MADDNAIISGLIAEVPTVPRKNPTVERILVVELWNIGDVILAMPFLAQLRCLFPQARITLLGQSFARDLLAGTGLVDDIMPIDLAWGGTREAGLKEKLAALWGIGRQLRARGFDIAFSARTHLRERILLWMSGAERRVGYAGAKADALLTDLLSPAPAAAHKVEQWMGLLAPFGGAGTRQAPRLHVDDEERIWAKGYLLSRGIAPDDVVVGEHPGASLAEKRWPLESFRETATAIVAQPGVRVLAFAEPSGYGSELFSSRGVVGARVSVRELIALIARCDLLVCNDSGPMHIAAALGVSTVAMFGAGIEKVFRAQGENHQALTPSADGDNLHFDETGIRKPTGIATAQVLDAVGRALNLLPRDRR